MKILHCGVEIIAAPVTVMSDHIIPQMGLPWYAQLGTDARGYHVCREHTARFTQFQNEEVT
jgi:hypothetical protein